MFKLTTFLSIGTVLLTSQPILASDNIISFNPRINSCELATPIGKSNNCQVTFTYNPVNNSFAFHYIADNVYHMFFIPQMSSNDVDASAHDSWFVRRKRYYSESYLIVDHNNGNVESVNGVGACEITAESILCAWQDNSGRTYYGIAFN
ncbi:MAG: hypothetical protein EA365_03870 [Gloeocapsa sp. DLM2.Bin57]|nr:MAG: hypothetical protein EA365_03870 [Gloeocapsa sp. DLM2.Bin57]